MEKNKQLEDFKQHLDTLIKGKVPITTSFNKDIAIALIDYAKKKGLSNTQDVIRLAVAQFLTNAGLIN